MSVFTMEAKVLKQLNVFIRNSEILILKNKQHKSSIFSIFDLFKKSTQ
jgi:hypothetical protein